MVLHALSSGYFATLRHQRVPLRCFIAVALFKLFSGGIFARLLTSFFFFFLKLCSVVISLITFLRSQYSGHCRLQSSFEKAQVFRGRLLEPLTFSVIAAFHLSNFPRFQSLDSTLYRRSSPGNCFGLLQWKNVLQSFETYPDF